MSRYRRRPYPRDPYWLTARYPGRCSCGARIQPGDRIFWYPNTRTALCATCGARGAADLANEQEYARANPVPAAMRAFAGTSPAPDYSKYDPAEIDWGMEDEALADERMEADMQMAELEAAGREFTRRIRAAKAAYLAGDKDKAARLCPHSSGYSTLKHPNCQDPMKGAEGARCSCCGSRLRELRRGAEVLVPCEIPPEW
jgi:hypothetical protein